jgi:hypothetical protein
VTDIREHLDTGSQVVIALTAVFFIVALFLTGLKHDLLLEVGVFLVSIKLIMMAYKNSVSAKQLNEQIARVEETLRRIEKASRPAA